MLNTKLYTVDRENPMKYTNILFKTVRMIDVAMHSHSWTWNKKLCNNNNNNNDDDNSSSNNHDDDDNNNSDDDNDDDNKNNNNSTLPSFSSKWMFGESEVFTVGRMKSCSSGMCHNIASKHSVWCSITFQIKKSQVNVSYSTSISTFLIPPFHFQFQFEWKIIDETISVPIQHFCLYKQTLSEIPELNECIYNPLTYQIHTFFQLNQLLVTQTTKSQLSVLCIPITFHKCT